MANYSLAIDTSNFKPYTFDDIIKPFLLYKEDYNAMSDKIDKYLDEYGNVLLPAESKYADKLKGYYADLLAAMEDFYNYGLNTHTGNALRQAFLTNRGKISSIKKSLEKYEEALKEYNKLKDDPTNIIISKPNVDDIIEGRPSTTEYVNGKNLREETAIGVKGILDSLELNVSLSSIGNGLLKLVISGQYSFNDLMSIANNAKDPETRQGAIEALQSPEAQSISKLFKNLYNHFNYTSLKEDALKNAFDSYIMQGISMGIPAPKVDVRNNPAYMNPTEQLQYRMNLDTFNERRSQYIWEGNTPVGYNPNTPAGQAAIAALKAAGGEVDEKGKVIKGAAGTKVSPGGSNEQKVAATIREHETERLSGVTYKVSKEEGVKPGSVTYQSKKSFSEAKDDLKTATKNYTAATLNDNGQFGSMGTVAEVYYNRNNQVVGMKIIPYKPSYNEEGNPIAGSEYDNLEEADSQSSEGAGLLGSEERGQRPGKGR